MILSSRLSWYGQEDNDGNEQQYGDTPEYCREREHTMNTKK